MAKKKTAAPKTSRSASKPSRSYVVEDRPVDQVRPYPGNPRSYGEPWRWWFEVLRHGRRDVTVFLTIGMVRAFGVGRVSSEAVERLGIAFAIPPGLESLLQEDAVDACLGAIHPTSWTIDEAKEAPGNKHTRYLGLRLSPPPF